MGTYNYLGEDISCKDSPIYGKRVHFIGDSNLQYIADELKTYLEATYGCIVTNSAQAGATWENPNGNVNTVTDSSSGVGQVNQVIANVDSSNLIVDYDIIITMLGTNCGTLGTMDDAYSDVSNMCGAMKWCMSKLCYYGRTIKLGVIIPPKTQDTTSNTFPQKFEYVKAIAEQYSVPILDMYNASRACGESLTPDGTDYYFGDSVHLGTNGKKHFKEIVGKWITYVL